MFDNLASALPNIKAGTGARAGGHDAQALAAAAGAADDRRIGIARFRRQYLVRHLAPAGTPPEIVARLNAEVVRLLHTAEMRERLALLGAEPIGNKPDEFAAFIKAEIPKYAKVIKASGAKVD